MTKYFDRDEDENKKTIVKNIRRDISD